MSDLSQMKARLRTLEEENARLRKGPAAKPTTTQIAMYKGFPVIRFEGSFRPFAIGLRKASIILEKIEDVRFFVDNNRGRLNSATIEDSE